PSIADQGAIPVSARALPPLYREWRALRRRGCQLGGEADRRCGVLDAPYPLVSLPGRGVVSRVEDIDGCDSLTAEDRERLRAEFLALESARLAAEDAAGITGLVEECGRLWPLESELAGRVIDAPARTLPDLHAKAMVGLAYAEGWAPRTDPERVLFALGRDLGAMMADARRNAVQAPVTERELLWWVLLHACAGWCHASDDRSMHLELMDGPPVLVVPVVPGCGDILPDTASPLWPAAGDRLREIRAKLHAGARNEGAAVVKLEVSTHSTERAA
ncbi:MAG TPA: hypothetical protein VGE72_22605, partial [Azospirillum sp.]